MFVAEKIRQLIAADAVRRRAAGDAAGDARASASPRPAPQRAGSVAQASKR